MPPAPDPIQIEVAEEQEGGYRRIPTAFAPPGAKRLCIFLDAEFYLDRTTALDTIVALVEREEVPPTGFAFLPHVDNAHRHVDFACNFAYAGYLSEVVVPEVRKHFPSLEENGHFLCGLSLSGLAGAHAVGTHPDRFAGAICQSGSFWWNDECLTDNAGALREKRLYLSVGDGEIQSGLSHAPSGMRQEVSQLDACIRFAERMREQDNEVRFEIFAGGHDYGPWSAELGDALRWLLG